MLNPPAQKTAQRHAQSVQVKLPPLHPNQLLVARDPSLFRVVAAGRRFGKSILACNEVTFKALVFHYPVWWVAPTYNNTLDAWKQLVSLAWTIPKHKIYKEEQLIEYPGGGTVKVVSAAKPDNVRGGGLGFVVYDECAYGPEEMWTEVLYNALMERDGGGLFISSPNGFNWFYRLYQKGRPGPHHEDGWTSFHFTSYDNPFIPREAIDRRKRELAQKTFEQEVLGNFREDAMGVFRGWREVIHHVQRTHPLKGNTHCMGIDWGRSHDYTAISVWDMVERREVALERFNDVGWELQRGRIAALIDHWNPTVIYAEENAAGEPNIEALQNEGFPVIGIRMTNPIKSALILGFALAIEKQECYLLDDADANEELQQFQQIPLPSGVMRYSSPKGGFDDTVIARSLAWSAIEGEIGDPVELDW